MQTYSSQNLKQRSTGRQSNIFLASGAAATSATYSIPFETFDYKGKEVDMVAMEGNLGDRSTNETQQNTQFHYKVPFAVYCGVNRIKEFLYLLTGGEPTINQDGATGAYKWDYTFLNSVELPPVTFFLNADAYADAVTTGDRRLSGGKLENVKVEPAEQEFKISGEFWYKLDEAYLNVASTLAPVVTTVAYQTATGLTRYTFTSAVALTTVLNGDVLDTASTTGISNAANKGKFKIVTISTGSYYVDVINAGRTDASLDEAGLTTSGTVLDKLNRITSYAVDKFIGARNGNLYNAATSAGLAAAARTGVVKLAFEAKNSSEEYFVGGDRNASDILGKNIDLSCSFTQILGTDTGVDIERYKGGAGVDSAWEVDYKDTAQSLGTSTAYYPELVITIPTTRSLGTLSNFSKKDHLLVDWDLKTFKEAGVLITLYNEKSALWT